MLTARLSWVLASHVRCLANFRGRIAIAISLIWLIHIACGGRRLRGVYSLVFTSMMLIGVIEGQILNCFLSVALLHVRWLVKLIKGWSWFFFNLHQRLIISCLMAQLRLDEVLDTSRSERKFILLQYLFRPLISLIFTRTGIWMSLSRLLLLFIVFSR